MITAHERIDELLTRTYTPLDYSIDIDAPGGRDAFDDAINANVDSIIEDLGDFHRNSINDTYRNTNHEDAILLAFQGTAIANSGAPVPTWPKEYLKRTAGDIILTNDFILHETLNLIEPLLETRSRRRLFRKIMRDRGHDDSRGLTYLIVDLYIELWNAAQEIRSGQ
jgi:hypothetical protein